MGSRGMVMTCGVLSASNIMRRTGSKGPMDRMMSTGGCMRLGGRTGHRQLGKVGARQPRLVRIMDDDRSIAKEGRVVGRQRGVEVKVLGHEGIRGDLAVLATQITDLTTLGLGSIASRRLATMIRVQMSQGARTVAIGSRLFVDVVHCIQGGLVSHYSAVASPLTGEAKNSLKGPPLLGKFSNWTLNLTPLPPGAATAETEPLTLPARSAPAKKGFLGRVALYSTL